MFDAVKVKNDCVDWIRQFFAENGPDCNAVLGISGGKDSSIVAALCVEALGKDRVIGVLMPDGEQADIDMSYKLVNHLGIRHYVVNIHDAVAGITGAIPMELTDQSRTNLPPPDPDGNPLCGEPVLQRPRGKHLQSQRGLGGLLDPLR